MPPFGAKRRPRIRGMGITYEGRAITPRMMIDALLPCSASSNIGGHASLPDTLRKLR